LMPFSGHPSTQAFHAVCFAAALSIPQLSLHFVLQVLPAFIPHYTANSPCYSLGPHICLISYSCHATFLLLSAVFPLLQIWCFSEPAVVTPFLAPVCSLWAPFQAHASTRFSL
jgi:hypothetical protein